MGFLRTDQHFAVLSQQLGALSRTGSVTFESIDFAAEFVDPTAELHQVDDSGLKALGAQPEFFD